MAHCQVLSIDANRTVVINGAVDGSILAQAQAIDKLSQTKGDIYIVINSPGGSVAAGMQFLNVMIAAKSRGSKLICAVPGMAASMAFHFLAECTERYALQYSLLLWHPMRVGGMFASFSADEMEYLIGVIRAWEIPLNNRLIESMGISKDKFYYHYSHETLFIPSQLHAIIGGRWIRVVKDIRVK